MDVVERANRFLSLWGHTPIATKADLLKTVDTDFRGAADFPDSVRSAREYLDRIKVKPPPKVARDRLQEIRVLIRRINSQINYELDMRDRFQRTA